MRIKSSHETMKPNSLMQKGQLATNNARMSGYERENMDGCLEMLSETVSDAADVTWYGR